MSADKRADTTTHRGGPRRRPRMTAAINRHQSLWIHERLKVLGWTSERLRDELAGSANSIQLFKPATDDRNRLTTVNKWVGGENGAPRQVFEILAEADPHDPNLLHVFDRLEVVLDLEDEPTALALNLALTLDHGFDDPSEEPISDPPPQKSTKKGQVWESAAYLLDLGIRSRKRSGRSVLIDVPGFEAAFDKLGAEAGGAQEWRRTLWRALLNGWHVRHVLSWDDQPAQLPDPVQAELVANLLYAAAVNGKYEPIIRSPRPSANVVAVQGVGVLTAWHDSYALRLDHTRGDDRELARSLSQNLIKAGTKLVGNRSAVPALVVGTDPYDRLRFDMALAAAECDEQSEHCMVKAGLPIALMPPNVTEEQEKSWRQDKPNETPYIHLHHAVRERRREAFNNSMLQKGSHYRDIITHQGVRRYLKLDSPPDGGDAGGAAFGGRYLNLDQRVQHARYVADLVERNASYMLGLVDENELLVPVDQNWWAATRGVGPDSRAVFFVVVRQEPGEVSRVRQGWLFDSGSTTMVDAFFGLFNLLWETLPDHAKNPEATVSKLRDWADEAEQA